MLSGIIKNRRVYVVVDLLLNLIFIVALAFFIRHFIVSPFHVFGPSMCDTLNYYDEACVDKHGDYIIVNEFLYQNIFGKSLATPSVFDVVVFSPPTDKSQYYVKRILGIPGDRLKIDNGYLYKMIDEEYALIDESAYLNNDNLGSTYAQFGLDAVYFDVPAGHYFVMGDNRNRSTDSRHCFSGVSRLKCDSYNENAFVPFENIRGKAWFVFFPFNRLKII